MQPNEPLEPAPPTEQPVESTVPITPTVPAVPATLVANPTETRKPKSKKSIFFIIFMVIIIGIGAFPVVSLGSVIVYCQVNSFNKDNKKKAIKEGLAESGITVKSQEVFGQGDCFTGSGAGMNLTVTGNYPSLMAAKDDIFSKLNEADIAAPSNDVEPEYIFGQYGNRGGGDTPIAQIEVVYSGSKDFGPYSLEINLSEPIPCVVNERGVVCAGEDQDTLLKKIINTTPISSVEISGSLR